MYEVTEVTSGATGWSMEIPAGHRAIISCFNELIGVWRWVGGYLRLLNFVLVLKTLNCLVCHIYELIVLD